MRPTTWLSKLGLLLAILGGINWGIIGIWKYNVVKAIFESTGKVLGMTTGERIVYIVAGAGAVIAIPLFLASLERARGSVSDIGERSPRSESMGDYEDRRAA